MGAPFASSAAGQVLSAPRARHTAAEIEPLLARISIYEYGADPEPVITFNELVEDLQGSPEQRKALETRLLSFLGSNATAAGKEVAFRQLALIGTDASIPSLAPLLVRAETAEMARHALAAIPGALAGEALRKSVSQAPNDRVRIGIISSLGSRRDVKSIPSLAALINAGNSEVALAAIAALANIANRPALDTLLAARKKAGTRLRTPISEACLACADRLGGLAAIGVYKQMMATSEPRTIRIRALAGLVSANAKAAVPLLDAELESRDPEVQAAAIKLLNGIAGPEITTVMVRVFPKLAAHGQVRMLSALAQRGDASAKPTVLAARKSPNPDVRAAAFGALGALGNETDVASLAEAAAGDGPEHAASRRSLYSIRGAGIDSAIISALAASQGQVKLELILAAGERGANSAADALVSAAQESDPEVRRSALLALRNVGGAAQIEPLLELLLKTASASERRNATQTLAMIAKRAQPAGIGALVSAYKSADLNSRLSILEILGQTSNEEVLPLLRDSMRDRDAQIARAGILALSSWDNATPLNDLLGYAQTVSRDLQASAPEDPEASLGAAARAGRMAGARNRPPGGGGRGYGSQPTNNLQVLALRGVLKLILLQPQRPAGESGRLLAAAMSLASQNAEKFAILSLLPAFPCPESLEVARGAENDPAVVTEAKVAAAQVTEAMKLK